MAKRQGSQVLKRLAGKKLVLNGKFGYGIEEVLKGMAEAQGGTLLADLDDKVDYLVLADVNASKTIQKKALGLNGKGASIQVIDAATLAALVEPTEEDFLALLRAGESETLAKLGGRNFFHPQTHHPKCTLRAESFKGTRLENAPLSDISFEGCSFAGANLSHSSFGMVTDCDFSKATADHCTFADVTKSKFQKASLRGARFQGDILEADFTGAALEEASFTKYFFYGQMPKASQAGVIFAKAKLNAATFLEENLHSPDFSGADLSQASFSSCSFAHGNFTKAKLNEAVLVNCTLTNTDFTNADLSAANLGGADLTGAIFKGANLKGAHLRGAILDGVDLSQAKNYDPNETPSGTVGPALTELDTVNSQARRINVSFVVRSSVDDEGHQVGIDTAHLKWGYGVRTPPGLAIRHSRQSRALSFSDAMMQLANVAGHLHVCYETVDVSSTKSPKGGKELRELVLQGIAEAFAQDLPAEEELAKATKEYRDAEREKGAEARQQREEMKAQAVKEKEKAKKQIAKKIEKEVGKVSDVASFLKALELRIEKPKIDKATKMLKASGFKLFNDITDEYVSGVVKSQTDADLVYACRVAHDGEYSCCTQNLNVCGGLRGSICKHLLVLIIGLVQAGELDPTTIDGWIAKTHNVKPELDKEDMGAIFIKYKGAEAGEVDWRPTETVPEDYYAF